MNTLMFVFVALTPFFGVNAQLQICQNGGSGPCLNGACPVTTERCINTTAGQVCCAPDQIVNASTVAPVTTTNRNTTAGGCVDRVNPRTGVSDCPRLSNLCSNPVYDAVMTRQCPKTCGRCGVTNSSSTTPGVCQDLVNPVTGTSDCPSRQNLCRDPNYTVLMRQQCRKTCQYC